MEEKFKGRAIYNPPGKAGEYAKWACNLFNGCSGKCTYCYNRKGRGKKILGGDVPTLKKSLIDSKSAIELFERELFKNIDQIRETGLFFSFVSDPCLPETWFLNSQAIRSCLINNIPVTLLTKQTWWIKDFVGELYKNGTIFNLEDKKDLFFIGFTLTGCDEEEPGASPNYIRINYMKTLKYHGFKTWASIEPIIDFQKSFDMIEQTLSFCDHYKIGLLSGSSQTSKEATEWLGIYHSLLQGQQCTYYFKDSILKKAGVKRILTQNMVDSNYNPFKD